MEQGIVGTYMTTHPSTFQQGQTIEAEVASAFQKALNRAPTAQDLATAGQVHDIRIP